jgi:hypothetical protein
MSEKLVSMEIPADLILALELARTRLSIAIASEGKSTPPARWQQYLDTADRISRFMRKLRENRGEMAANIKKAGRVLEALQQLALENDVRRLCRILEDMVSDLE